MLKFYYNGIKSSDKEGLQKCFYSFRKLINGEKCIKIYGRERIRFSKEIREAFEIKNESDMQTDYGEDDSIYIFKSNPYFYQVADAYTDALIKTDPENTTIDEVLEWAGE